MDYAVGAGVAATPPAGLLAMEYFSPTFTKGVFAPVLRLNAFLGLGGGLIIMHTRSVRKSKLNGRSSGLISNGNC